MSSYHSTRGRTFKGGRLFVKTGCTTKTQLVEHGLERFDHEAAIGHGRFTKILIPLKMGKLASGRRTRRCMNL